MRRILYALSGGLLLVACGPNGPGASGAGTAPPPSAPSPTPTPTPVASYPTFDALAGDQDYPTACAGAQFPGGLLTVGPTTDFGSGLQFAYRAATRTYTLDGDGISLSFGPADYTPQAPGIDVWIRGDDFLSLEALTWAGTPMVYNRVAYVNTRKSGILVAYACITGIPTLAFDVPISGIASFPNAGADAYATGLPGGSVVTYGFRKAPVSFEADFAARKVTVIMHLIATTAGSPPHVDVDLGTMSGSGAIDPATGRFSGTWTSNDRDLSGTFAGSFFGPHAQEFGLAYAVEGRDGSGAPDFAAHGVINGSR